MARRKPGEGQTALVTGASAGIGVDLAECFAKDGYDLILTARSEGALQEVANRLSAAHGVKAHTVAQDLGAHGGGSAVAAAVARDFSFRYCTHGYSAPTISSIMSFGPGLECVERSVALCA